MATLTAENITDVSEFIQSELSRVFEQIPVSRQALETLLGLIDTGLETAETSILTSLPAGNGKTWLIDHPSISRRLIILIAEKRREVL